MEAANLSLNLPNTELDLGSMPINLSKCTLDKVGAFAPHRREFRFLARQLPSPPYASHPCHSDDTTSTSSADFTLTKVEIPVKNGTDDCYVNLRGLDGRSTWLSKNATCRVKLDEEHGTCCVNDWFITSDEYYLTLNFYSKDSSVPEEGQYEVQFSNGETITI